MCDSCVKQCCCNSITKFSLNVQSKFAEIIIVVYRPECRKALGVNHYRSRSNTLRNIVRYFRRDLLQRVPVKTAGEFTRIVGGQRPDEGRGAFLLIGSRENVNLANSKSSVRHTLSTHHNDTSAGDKRFHPSNFLPRVFPKFMLFGIHCKYGTKL